MEQLSIVVNVLTIVALVSGFAFAAREWRASRLERHRQSQILPLRSFDSPEFLRAMRLLLALPDGLTKQELESWLGDAGLDLLWTWFGAMESLGILAFHREIEIGRVDQSFRSPVMVIFGKVRGYIDGSRAAIPNDTMYEWYEWLVDRMNELQRDRGRVPAQIAHAHWRP